ncbi:MAG: acetyl/propionyl/methylcrotonyl-CoA carboxylase subunit alpha [Pseudomonadota bacterium]
MFKKILIANRGEIACRVIETAKKMSIGTVAVFSDADRNARHVEMADEAVHIGPSAAAESYLVIDKIISACQSTGAEAVHPGYGFLSENAAFVDALDAAGIAFIGPRKRAIEAMGDKITSKKIAEEAGVNVIPGHTEVVKDADEAVEISDRIGYPVMIKASAGGGGKGMRVAYNEEECREGFVRATSEAVSSFGDGRIFIEKFVDQPRHIEIQIIADAHGNVITLNERECSIQRRHQKVIEEAPSPFIDEGTRDEMSRQAISLARAVDYESAGTVELIVDGNRKFYFLEMNTRLQVEHPVTELITGLDLVEMMIKVAAGEKLPIEQKDVQRDGWAIESRIYAESAFRNFLPSTGRLVRYQVPQTGKNVRVDTGVTQGSEISMFYDPMIAKLVTWAETRTLAIEAMETALNEYYIRGVDTNLPFLSAIMANPRFREGSLTTNFIAEEYPDGFSPDLTVDSPVEQLAAIVTSIHDRLSRRAASTSGQLPGYGRKVSYQWTVLFDTHSIDTEVEPETESRSIRVGDREFRIADNWIATEPVFRASVNDAPICMHIEKTGYTYVLTASGREMSVKVLSRRAGDLHQHMPVKEAVDLSGFLLSPMPGLLVSVPVEAGQTVKAGEELAVIEAMKMENSMRAEREVVVDEVLVEQGNTLEVDQPIIRFRQSD